MRTNPADTAPTVAVLGSCGLPSGIGFVLGAASKSDRSVCLLLKLSATTAGCAVLLGMLTKRLAPEGRSDENRKMQVTLISFE